MDILGVAAVLAAAYLLGCCNTSIVISKYILHDDVRGHGSGNAGLTNFYRVFGKKKVGFVILADVLKTVLSCLLGGAVFGTLFGAAPLGKLVAGICCMLGHSFPCMFGFKGGKGVLTGGTLAFMLDWRLALVVWGVFLVTVAISRMVSLGSMLAAAAFPIMAWVVFRDVPMVVLSVAAGVLIVWRHKDNTKRILHGEENKFEFHK